MGPHGPGNLAITIQYAKIMHNDVPIAFLLPTLPALNGSQKKNVGPTPDSTTVSREWRGKDWETVEVDKGREGGY